DHLVHLDRLRALASDVAASAPVDHSIGALVRRHGATHLQCTPSMARMLLDGGDVSALGSLRCWMVGGEALTPEIVRDIRAVTSAELLNMYGPTETTVWSTTHAVRDAASNVPIGRPIANARAYVLDARGEPLARGVTGELFLAGDGVARGYLG